MENTLSLNKNSNDREMIAELITKLSEFSNGMPETTSSGKVNTLSMRKNYLFGFDPVRPASLEEYKQYFAFLDIVSRTMEEFGIRISNNGYAYILDAVKIIIDRKSFDLRLNNDIYPLISMKYHMKNPAAIEHSIRNAINNAYEDHTRNPGSNNMGIFVRKPTNKQFLMYVADIVWKNMGDTMIEYAG